LPKLCPFFAQIFQTKRLLGDAAASPAPTNIGRLPLLKSAVKTLFVDKKLEGNDAMKCK